ncbi:hypothetical protein J7399_07090 [Shimia sp. R9_1]|uniref:hypothetical protein n=1 Tax=Shimia sp. R9_1 TaxID=2821111 RepID=UPI001AD9A02B|nr:hypothetical protein [Shimia sp. R9_1]MBO9407184.1 hypothetical protein [Shimia sp. R9_1]
MRVLNRGDKVLCGSVCYLDTKSQKYHRVNDYASYLLWLRLTSYPNIVQSAELYCQKFWGASVYQVVKGTKEGPIEEPETGEMMEGTCSSPRYQKRINGQNVVIIDIKKTLVGYLGLKQANVPKEPLAEHYLLVG